MQLRGGAHAKVAAAIHRHQLREDDLTASDIAIADENKQGPSQASRTAKRKKTSSTTRKASKSKAKNKAEKAATKSANIAKLANIEDRLAKEAKEAASANPRRPAPGECSRVFYCTHGDIFFKFKLSR